MSLCKHKKTRERMGKIRDKARDYQKNREKIRLYEKLLHSRKDERLRGKREIARNERKGEMRNEITR